MLNEYTDSAKKDIKRLQSRLLELQKENAILRAQLRDGCSSFYSRLVDFVESLYLCDKMSDLKIKTPKKDYPGHRFVFDARGGVWDYSVQGGVEFIEIVGEDQDICEALISWAYRDELDSDCDASFLCKLMQLAKHHELFELLQRCESALIPLATKDNCIELYAAAYAANSSQLLERCFSLLSFIWPSVSKSQLCSLSAPVLCSILEKQTRFPLHSAIRLGRCDAAKSLMEQNLTKIRTLVNSTDESGLSPLYLALQRDQTELAEQLVRAGADCNLPVGSSDQKLPMGHYALLNGEYKTVSFLVDHEYQVDFIPLSTGNTLLHIIAMASSNDVGHLEVVKLTQLLLNKGANLDAKDKDGNTPVHLAILSKNVSIFELFMKYRERFNLDAPNNVGVPPLWLALVSDFSDIPASGFDAKTSAVGKFSKTLVEAGANVNYRFQPQETGGFTIQPDPSPKTGDTLLSACCRCRMESAALFLLEQNGCSVLSESTVTTGETVYHLAMESKLSTLGIRLATSYRVDPNQLRLLEVDCPSNKGPKPEQKEHVASPKQIANPFELFPDETTTPSCTAEPSDHFETPFDSESLSERMDPDGQGQGSNGSEVESVQQNVVSKRLLKQTPLHLAMFSGLNEVVELYLDNKTMLKADWFVLDESGESVFSLALWSRQFDLASRVLIAATRQYQQNLRSGNGFGQTSVLANFSRGIRVPSLLHRAVEHGDTEAVQFLLRHGIDVNESVGTPEPYPTLSNDGHTESSDLESRTSFLVCPLWAAVSKGKYDIAKLLISHSADINRWEVFSGTSVQVSLIHRSIYAKDVSGAIFLIANGCDVNGVPRVPELLKNTSLPACLDPFKPQLAWTPLHMAVAADLVDIVSALLQCERTKVNQQDVLGNTALHVAVKGLHNQEVSVLLRCPAVDCSVKNSEGHTAFHVAMECRNVIAAHALLARDRTLALQTDNAGRNFLHIALQKMDRAAVFFLIQAGVDMNQCVHDPNQYTPLHLAIISGVPEDIFRSLLLAGASISSRTPQKHTPLHLCVLHNRPELLRCLLENGADVNEQDAEKNTPLHLAIRTANIGCLTILLNHEQTDCCVMNIRGQLPVHLLPDHNPAVSVEMLQHLFEVCVAPQVNAKDASGNTPLLLAYQTGNVPLCIALVHAGASLGTSNVDGNTVFSLSTQRNRSPAPDHILSQILDSLMEEPKWEDGLTCVECGTKFGLTIRKHHW
ncbi:unnamed protein product [Calicophoron daubneyi]|uniref:Uncharacterized protein n=1 Tax=Calicophoron daubneyi TaxID=300641 RepID=A0AAV2TFY1_CALDB